MLGDGFNLDDLSRPRLGLESILYGSGQRIEPDLVFPFEDRAGRVDLNVPAVAVDPSSLLHGKLPILLVERKPPDGCSPSLRCPGLFDGGGELRHVISFILRPRTRDH